MSVTDNTLQPAQFTVGDVGSDWTTTKATHRLHHKGKDITVISNPKTINRQKKP